jgi:hypothetical protein
LKDVGILGILLGFGYTFVIFALSIRLPYMEKWITDKDGFEFSNDPANATKKKLQRTTRDILFLVRTIENLGASFFIAGLIFPFILTHTKEGTGLPSPLFVVASNAAVILTFVGYIGICCAYLHHRFLRNRWPLDELLEYFKIWDFDIEDFLIKN